MPLDICFPGIFRKSLENMKFEDIEYLNQVGRPNEEALQKEVVEIEVGRFW